MKPEQEFWKPEPIFAGQTVFVLASGPSMSEELAERVRGRATIVVNSTVRLAPWASVWFFTDTGVFERHKNEVETFGGRIVTMSKRAKRERPERILRVRGAWMPEFPPAGEEPLRQGRSSGQTAASLAIACAAAAVVLLGLDMRVVSGQEHHHCEYAGRSRDLDIYAREFVPAWSGWRDQARRSGVQIMNATPRSALQEFPHVTLDEVLGC